MLEALIDKKIDEIIKTYCTAMNAEFINSSEFDSGRLKQIKSALRELIERSTATKMESKSHQTFYVVQSNYDTYVRSYDHIDMDKFFYEVSKTLAFSDCSDERILGIFYNGKEVEYAGWQPNMRYTFKDNNGLTIWTGDFPEWDH